MPIWKITYDAGVAVIPGCAVQWLAVLQFEREYPGHGGSIVRVDELTEPPASQAEARARGERSR